MLMRRSPALSGPELIDFWLSEQALTWAVFFFCDSFVLYIYICILFRLISLSLSLISLCYSLKGIDWELRYNGRKDRL
jgi:hypothetical protein